MSKIHLNSRAQKKTKAHNSLKKLTNFTKSKRGETTTMQFLITLLISLGMIALVVVGGIKLWNMIFPGSDKQTKANMVALYSLMEMQANTKSAYDSRQLNIYVAEGYQIFYFPSGEPGQTYWTCGKSSAYVDKKIYKPTKCGKGACLCMYSKSPSIDKVDEKDKNVKYCKTFQQDVVVTAGSFQLNKDDCSRRSGKNFDMLVGETTAAISGHTLTSVFVYEATEENKKLDAENKKAACPVDPSDVCSGQKDGAILTSQIPSDNMYSKILTQCKAQTPAKYAIEARCVLDLNANKCSLNCNEKDFLCKDKNAAKVKTCEDYNKYSEYGTFAPGRTYLTKGSAAEWACLNDQQMCSVSGDTEETKCAEKEIKVYSCFKNSCDSEVNSMKSKCAFVFDSNDMILQYDTNNVECSTFMHENFREVNQYYCKEDKKDECTKFIVDNIDKDCYIVSKGYFVVSYKVINMCQDKMTELFDPVYTCSKPIVLPETVVTG